MEAVQTIWGLMPIGAPVRIVDEECLDLFRGWGPCEWCGLRVWCDPHHVFSKGAGRLDVVICLVSLCRACHTCSHAGQEPTRLQLIRVVARREKVTEEFVVDEIARLRRLDKDGQEVKRPTKGGGT